MTAENIKNWLKTQTDFGESIEVGGIDGNKERCIGVYNAGRRSSQRICIGGEENTKFQLYYVSVVLRWTKSSVVAESKADELYSLFFGKSHFVMDGVKVIYTDPGASVIPIGRDKKDIFEYVLNIEIGYEKE